VDQEVLTLRPLKVVHPVMPTGADAAQHDAVETVTHRPASVAARTASASTVERTSWTRTPQAPAWMASRLVATVAASRGPTGRGAPSGRASSRPRYDLRLAPTSTG